LTFSTKDTILIRPALLRSWLSQQKIYILIRPAASMWFYKIFHITALLRSWLSQQRYLFWSAPLRVWINYIFWSAALLRSWLLNKRYLFWSAPLRVCYKYIFKIAVLTLSTKDIFRSAPTYNFANKSYHGSSSVLTFSTKDTIWSAPLRVLFNYIFWSAALLRSWLSQQKIPILIRPASFVL